MKLVALTSYVSRRGGGLFNSVRRLLQTQAEQSGVAVNVLSVMDDFTLADLPAWRPLAPETFPVRGPASFRYAPELGPRLAALDPDLIRVDGIWDYPSVVAKNWTRRVRRPEIVAPRGMLDEWALRQWRAKKLIFGLLFERLHLRGATCLHALCEPELQACRAFGLKNPVAVVPNGMDVPEPGSCAPMRLPAADGRRVLLYLGRIHPKKGLPNLLSAWAALKLPQPSPWVLAIAGWDQDGHEAQLQRQAGALGLAWSTANSKDTAEASVIFLGPRFEADKDAAYARADAFVLPSFSEGLPMVVLEAWAHAKPVLMTPECNLPAGFEAAAALRIETSSDSIASGLRLLMEMTDAERSDMGARGRALVVAKFSWPRVAAQMHEVCQWVLGGGPRPYCVVTE